MRTRSILVLCCASLLWSASWILAPLLEQIAAPFAAAACTFAVAAGVLMAASPLFRKPSHTVAAGVSLPATVLLSLAMFAVPVMLLLVAGRHGIGGWAPLLYALLPLFLSLAADAWSPGMVLAVGAVLVLLNDTVSFTAVKLLWAIPALAAVLTQGFALRYAAKRLHGCTLHSLLKSLAVQCALTSALFAAGSFAADPAPRLSPLGQWTSLSLAALLLFASLSVALAYALLYWLLGRGELAPHQVAVTQWLQTLAIVAEGAAFERVCPPWLLLAAALALAGCAWSTLRKHPGADGQSLTLNTRAFLL